MMIPSVLLLVLAQVGPGTLGQDERLQIVSITSEKSEVRRGEVVRIALEVEIENSWHSYAVRHTEVLGRATEFLLDPNLPIAIHGAIEEPPTHLYKVEGLPDQQVHEGRVRFVLPVWVKPEASPGPLTISGTMKYQICNPRVCEDRETPFRVDVRVSDALPVQEAPPVAAATPRGGGRWGLIGAAALAGLATLLFPCVFPLIPITISYFARQGQKSSTGGTLLAASYASGIVLSFTGIGFLMSLLLGATGAREFAANPYVNLFVAALFVYFALSMFGVTRIALPSSLTGGAASKRREGLGGAFVLGCLFSVVTFTCTAPIASTVLALAAGGESFDALLGMFAYSGTMAAPFLLLGIFPGLIRRVPRAGGWMQTTERVMGLVEFGLAAFYLSKVDQTLGFGILHRQVMLWVYVGVCAAVALYLGGGAIRLRSNSSASRMGRIGFAILFLGLGGYLATGLGGKPLGWIGTILPPRASKGFPTLEEALAKAKETGRPVFVEFTGVT